MSKIDNELFYKSSIKKYGTSHRGVHWSSLYNQYIRFETILKMIQKDIKDISIADAGCGFGDLYIYMKKYKNTPKHYLGIDSLKCMVDLSKKRTKQNIIQADICKEELPKVDYYICSGAMNTLTLFETYLFIQNCYNSSRYGFIFNILHGDKTSDTYNYIDTKHIKQIVKKLDVKNIELDSTYLDNDITVGFFK
ncbi:MAG: class I SAM-dependent methyltransferase [Campylobacterales bacterium]|nr:class I SAM-dependent methyltransferase [Campylobacterales bacterium]